MNHSGTGRLIHLNVQHSLDYKDKRRFTMTEAEVTVRTLKVEQKYCKFDLSLLSSMISIRNFPLLEAPIMEMFMASPENANMHRSHF